MSSGDIAAAEKIAQSAYRQRMVNILKGEQETIRAFLNNYKPLEKYRAYEDLSQPRQSLIKPYAQSSEVAALEWFETPAPENRPHPEGQIFETNRHGRVRSKSEVLIADKYSLMSVLYRYEEPLLLPGDTHPIYPDFTIMNPRTGDVFYHEHFGMMDDPEYASRACRKINRYARAGIILGKQLFITMETSSCPLDISAVAEMAREYFI